MPLPGVDDATTSHSAGPWAVEGRGGVHMDGTSDGYTIVDANGRRLHNPFMTQADATLAAAAPDMLMVCKRIPAALSEIQDIMRKNGLKLDDLTDPMQKLAFTIYSSLAELDMHARYVIAEVQIGS